MSDDVLVIGSEDECAHCESIPDWAVIVPQSVIPERDSERHYMCSACYRRWTSDASKQSTTRVPVGDQR